MWFEELPAQCPPADATTAPGMYYRLVKTEPPTCEDFWSQRKHCPDQLFHATECIARAVSLFTTREAAEQIKKLPLHKSKKIVAIRITELAGVLKHTGQNKDHRSWWRMDSYNPVEHLINELQR